MCGIVGIIGREPVAALLLDALARLEYRGYDSAGLATLEKGRLERRRAEGKLRNLAAKVAAEPLFGRVGIGHTRWATHGRPSETNAHPHASGGVAVVHNGIIENFRDLREELTRRGAVFHTQTDTEVVVHLVAEAMKEGLDPVAAVGASLPRLKGAFALAFLFDGREDLLIGARRGAPLAVGFGEDEMYLGSDALALAPFTDRLAYLEDGDWVVLTRAGAVFRDGSGAEVERPAQRTQAASFLVDKGNHRHFMAKEIHEQPEVVGRTLAHYLDLSERSVRLPFELPVDPSSLTRITIAACGTAHYAGMIAKYWFERFARLGADVDVASEFRYREPPLTEGGLTIVISQSGETADTLASLRYARTVGQKTLAVVNVLNSTIARESDVVAPTLAGPEIGVASTKAFVCQLAVLACIAVAFGRARGVLDRAQEIEMVDQLVATPGLIAEAIKLEPGVEELARRISHVGGALYLGRGASYPLALEGALKLKEISYIRAEGYAAGELKHGPIALIEEDSPVIVIAPFDDLVEKTISNMQEVAARGGRIILVGDERTAVAAGIERANFIALPEMNSAFSPMVYAVPIQFLAYHAGVVMGKDVDQPRNLAKSVTVE